ncbi:hypothetical protein AVEN_65747-1, partial [Araneus ventricosus]
MSVGLLLSKLDAVGPPSSHWCGVEVGKE